MRALVTGSQGFIGSHFARHLLSLGWTVDECDIQSPSSTPAEHVFENIATAPRYDLIVHCAYHVGGRVAIERPSWPFLFNVNLDVAMFRWAIESGQKRVLYFSSSAAYPAVLQQFSPIDGFEADTFRLRESDFIVDGMEYSMGRRRDETSGVPTPDSMYGLAKTLGEYLALNAREYGLKVHVVRPFSGYGEAQSLSYPLPSIVKRAIDGEPLVWGPPEQARDWIHVDDVVRGAMAVVSADHEEAVNLCTGEPTTMGGVLARAWSAARGTALADDAIQYDLEKPTGVLYRVGDPTEMRKYYTPTVGLDEGIDRAVKYMKRM